MTNIFNDPRNFTNPNNPIFPNSYKFDNTDSMSSFSKQLSHSAGVKNINKTDGRTLNVNFVSDSFRQHANDEYTKLTQ